MSFNQNTNGRGYAPGWLLAEEACARETHTIHANDEQAVTLADGSKIVPMGAIYSETSGTGSSATTKYIGLLYEDVEVTKGDMPGSVVTRGTVYEDRLPVEVSSAVKTALAGITFKTVPTVTRPEDET